MRVDAKSISWEKVEVLGKDGLFTCLRVDRNTVPEGYYMYEVRHDDVGWGDPVEIALGVLVNHYGTLLMKEPLDLIPSEVTSNAYLYIDPEEDWNYSGGIVKLVEGS